MWQQISKIIGIAIAALFFVLGLYLLLSPKFFYIPKEIRVIFSVFLFLYGAFRVVRYLFKDRDREEDN